MIEEIVLNYLHEKLGIPVYTEIPKEITSNSYILIEKTGSSESNFIYSSTIAVQSHAESLYEAAKLNKQVKEKMRDIVALDEVSKCSLNSDYNYTDTSKKRYRYQAVFNIVHY